ncbi:MAG: M20/M25/M40 family metallo-hydrolase [Dethiobacteria bacterium]
MNKENLVGILLELSSTAGVSGDEAAAVKAARSQFSLYTDEVKLDRFGNLIALKKGEAPPGEKLTLALIAHIDEIGLMVTKIEPGGFLRFTSLGGIDARVLPGQAVVVHGKKTLEGAVGATAPHLLSPRDRTKTVPIEKLFIDTGYDDQTLNNYVRVGDTISFGQKPILLETGKRVTGKALDNRAGVAALIFCAAELTGLRHQADLCFIASLQEEVGLRGAITSAYGLKPDLAVAVDVTHGDIPGVDEKKTFKIGDGPALGIGPNFYPPLSLAMQQTAKEYNLPFQVEPIPAHSGTDAWAFQVSREGVPTALLSIPLRYMHTTVEMLDIDDLISGGRLLARLAARMNKSYLGELRGC